MFNKSFLEDEVRDGFYIPSTIKQAWAAELEVLQAIADVCRKLNIKYYAEWGTLLGAVRHQGFIPWDDDIDIAMLRDDYNIFMEKALSLLPDGYTIHTFRNEEGFREFRATVINSPSPNFNKDHYDKFHGFCYLCGVDIYVLDYVHKDYQNEEKRFKDILYLISLADSIVDNNLSFSIIKPNLKHVYDITGVSLSDISDRNELWLKLYELVEKKCSELSVENENELSLLIPWGLKKSPRTIQSFSDYSDTITLPFEYIGISVPFNYTNVLSKRFSNYLIPIKQSGSHKYPFFQKQIDDLNALLGYNSNEYSFMPEFIHRTKVDIGEWKSLLNDAHNFLIDISGKILNTLDNGSLLNDETLNIFIDNILNAQDIAIETGNLIEAVKGEDYSDIQYISDYCEQLYILYNYLENTDCSTYVKNNENRFFLPEDLILSFKSVSDSFFETIKRIIAKKEIVFLPFKSSYWEVFDDIYKKYNHNEDYDIFIIPIPYFYKEYDSSLIDIQYDIDSYPNNLNIVSYENFSLEYHCPDIIFIQNPYDEHNSSTSIHPDFYSTKLKKYTNKLVYIPWFKTCEIDENDLFTYTNMKHFVTVPGVVNSDLTLVYTDQEKKMYVKKLTEWSGNEYREFWDKKICLFMNEFIEN